MGWGLGVSWISDCANMIFAIICIFWKERVYCSLCVLLLFFADIDECLTDNICQHKCRNVQGTYFCTCNRGYQLREDKRSCEGKK